MMQLSPADIGILQRVLGLLQSGDVAGAARAIVGVSPAAMSHPDALYVAAQILVAQGRMADAQRTLEGAIQQAPGNPHYWNALGELQAGDAAADCFAKAAELAPNEPAFRHNLATALRVADDYEGALAEIGARNVPVPTQTLRAHLLADLGRFDEAVMTYRAAIARDPSYLDAQETLARLLPQIGRAGEALDDYAAALEAGDRPLWESAIAAAKDLKQADLLVKWSNDAASRFGDDLFFSLARAIGIGMTGEGTKAIDQLRSLAEQFPDQAGICNHLAPLLIAQGDWDEAERHLNEAVRLAPLDQSGWAWLSIVWRLQNDPREEWLADYDRLVMPIDLDIGDVAATLHGLHLTSTHPAEQSPRGGTQTRGNLFDRRIPQVQALAATIKTSVEARLAQLKPDPNHPFLSRLSGGIEFAGSWSVRLANAGYHASHIHQAGWLSSACYIALPDLTGQEGALTFGVPDESLGLNLTPRRVECPAVGRLVIFPSYVWHGTVPFQSAQSRLTVAFDALPAGQTGHTL